ncbi:kinase-like domain-containing protein [Hypoxylon sp. FL0543]|nr:kinase-like domain-containing protein [Hypoxylon sp. FL0543]
MSSETPDGKIVQNRLIRYETIRRVGSGAFGRVMAVRDKRDRIIMAVKILKSLHNTDRTMREVTIVKKLDHPNLISYISSQKWGGLMEIFMELKDGNLVDLMRREQANEALVSPFLKQMLMALDYLANRDVIHRDIKPENILYVKNPQGGYIFQLADFGLSHENPDDAKSLAGTQPYMAPEVGRQTQTHKIDVWSLFMTLVWIYNVGDFRAMASHLTREQCYPMWKEATKGVLKRYRNMGAYWTGSRASAAEMLVALYHLEPGELTTKRDEVRPLLDVWEAWPGHSI